MIEENFRLRHRDSLGLQCTLRLPQGPGPFRLVVVAHGFRGFKDWGFFPCLGESLCRAGFAALSFNHALCGVGGNPYEITDYQGFSRNTTTQELKDWELLLDTILTGQMPWSERLGLNRLGVVGHSRGGSYGILMASRWGQIQSVVTWGAISTFQRFDSEAQERWRREGFLEFSPGTGETPLRLSVQALEALERNYDRLDVLKAMRQLGIRVLILHGREDRIVPLEEAWKLYHAAPPQLTRLHIVEAAGHTFRTEHPLQTPSLPLQQAMSETVSWFEKTLHT